jgi:hypothetical protein
VYNFTVTNYGNTSVNNVVVNDPKVSGITQVTQPNGKNIGDVNSNNVLDPGETWRYRASSMAATGEQCNTATATARVVNTTQTVSDTDTACYVGIGVNNGTPLKCGDTATIGYWQNKNGQHLIKSVNGGGSSTKLGNWLATNFPALYGAQSANNLTGKTNNDVASLFVTFYNKTGPKVEAQTMAVALAVYMTDSDLAGHIALSYGFNVSSSGTGAKVYYVGSLGSEIGLVDGKSYTIFALLTQANAQKSAGTFDTNAFNTIFDGINRKGDLCCDDDD